jgi:hypothetical protein
MRPTVLAVLLAVAVGCARSEEDAASQSQDHLDAAACGAEVAAIDVPWAKEPWACVACDGSMWCGWSEYACQNRRALEGCAGLPTAPEPEPVAICVGEPWLTIPQPDGTAKPLCAICATDPRPAQCHLPCATYPSQPVCAQCAASPAACEWLSP